MPANSEKLLGISHFCLTAMLNNSQLLVLSNSLPEKMYSLLDIKLNPIHICLLSLEFGHLW